MGQPQPLFHLFSSFRTEKFSCQQDSNSDRQSRMRELRPPDHQKFIFQPGIPYNLTTTDDSRLMGEHNQVSYLDVLFGDKSGGFFVEAGAFDGELFSNTLLLEKNRGWTGLLVSLQSYVALMVFKPIQLSGLNQCLDLKYAILAAVVAQW